MTIVLYRHTSGETKLSPLAGEFIMSQITMHFDKAKNAIKEIYDDFKSKLHRKKHIESDINIESKLRKRAEDCLDFLDKKPNIDSHSPQFDSLFLSSFSILEGSKKVEKMTKSLLWFTVTLTALTIVLAGMAYFDIPEYPLYGERVTPTISQNYIDYGDKLVHKTEYSIKKSKFWPSNDIEISDNIVIELLTDVQGFKSIYDTRGYGIKPDVDSSKRTVNITNVDGINPVLLDITYIERDVSPLAIAIMQPINPSSNESFYLFIRTAQYDIKYATVNYSLVEKANLWLNTTTYDSWKNQSIVIYENGIPFANPKVESDGSVNIDIYSLKVGEYKSYLIKKY